MLLHLPSTATEEGETLSRIVSVLRARTFVTEMRHQVDLVISEYGAAALAGRTTEGRREALIGVAARTFATPRARRRRSGVGRAGKGCAGPRPMNRRNSP